MSERASVLQDEESQRTEVVECKEEQPSNCFKTFLRKITPNFLLDCFEELTGREKASDNGNAADVSRNVKLFKKSENKQNRIYQPKNEIQVIKLILRLKLPFEFHTLFWEFGEKLDNAELLCRTWKTILTTRNDLTQGLTQSTDFLDLLFDHYSFFLDVSPVATIKDVNDVRLQLISLIEAFLLLMWNHLTLNTKHATFLWLRLFKFLNYSQQEVQIEVFRLISQLHRGLIYRTGKQETHLRISKMLDLMNPNTIVFRPAMQLAIETGQLGSTQIMLVLYILKVHFRDQNDVELIHDILMSPCPKNPLCVFQYLLINIIDMKILATSIIEMLVNVMPRFMKVSGLREWMTEYVNKTFEFFFCLDSTRKYRWKQSILLKLMSALTKMKVLWLSRIIRWNALCCTQLGACKKLFGKRFDTANKDLSRLHIYQNMKKKEPSFYKRPFAFMRIDYPEKVQQSREYFIDVFY